MGNVSLYSKSLLCLGFIQKLPNHKLGRPSAGSDDAHCQERKDDGEWNMLGLEEG